MIFRILVGLILVVLGGLITIYSNQIHEAVGPIAWAEEHLGTEGGSRLMYKLIGIGFSVVGFMLMTGLLGPLLLSIVKFLFPGLGRQ